MKRWRGLQEIQPEWGRSVVTIGVFDGVHRGHQRVIEEVVLSARRNDFSAVVITFDPHPVTVVRPEVNLPVLTSLEHKTELLANLGVDGLCVLPFTPEFSRLTPADFVHQVLVSALHTAEVIVGENFRFGHRAVGDVALLQQLGKEAGFSVQGHQLLRFDNPGSQTIFSSSFVRSCLSSGDVETTATILGRSHRVDGLVVEGQHRGQGLGFPTANVQSPANTAVPADGVYAGYLVRLHNQANRQHIVERLPAAISVGSNPTFGQQSRTVEAHVLDFDGLLYNQEVGVEFVSRLRSMEAFKDAATLTAQIAEDVEQTRKILRMA